MLARSLHVGTRIKHPDGHYGYASICELHKSPDRVWGWLKLKDETFDRFAYKPKDEVEARR